MGKRRKLGKAEKALRDLGKTIDDLIDKTKDSKGEMKTEMDKRIDELKKSRDSLEERLKNFKEDHSEDIEKFENYMEQTAEEVKTTMEKFFSKFKKK